MKTHSLKVLSVLVAALGLLPFLAIDRAPAADPAAAATRGLCASVPRPLPLPERPIAGLGGLGAVGGVGELGGLAAVVAAAPRASLPALLGALGQLIVEAQLSQAPVSGRFEPVISTAVADSALALEVCRDSIVGEVSIASRPGLRFVIGDFNADGFTDVAVRRPDNQVWSVDLGSAQPATAGSGPAVPSGDSAQPGAATGADRRILPFAAGCRRLGTATLAG